MNAIKNELIKKINSYPDSYDKTEMLNRLVMDTKLEESLSSYQENGAVSHEDAKKIVAMRQNDLKDGKISL